MSIAQHWLISCLNINCSTFVDWLFECQLNNCYLNKQQRKMKIVLNDHRLIDFKQM